MEETVEPEIYDGPLDEPVTERLDQISKKLDGLNKCSISTVQMAKKVYAGLEEVKQVSGNLRAEIGKFHTTSARLTQDLKQVDREINSMQERVDETCSALETRIDQLVNNIATEQQMILNSTAEKFLASLMAPGPGNPIHGVGVVVCRLRTLVWVAIVVGLLNLVLILGRW
jgi:septal ring factor EnvC (AmiA/AmiB activator)